MAKCVKQDRLTEDATDSTQVSQVFRREDLPSEVSLHPRGDCNG